MPCRTALIFAPLGLTAFDSFAQPQTATLCLLRRHLPFKGVPNGRAKKDVTFAHSMCEVRKGADARVEIVNINPL